MTHVSTILTTTFPLKPRSVTKVTHQNHLFVSIMTNQTMLLSLFITKITVATSRKNFANVRTSNGNLSKTIFWNWCRSTATPHKFSSFLTNYPTTLNSVVLSTTAFQNTFGEKAPFSPTLPSIQIPYADSAQPPPTQHATKHNRTQTQRHLPVNFWSWLLKIKFR